MIDGPLTEGLYGDYRFDDEGTPAQRTVLIENGVLKNYLTDVLSSQLYGLPLTGNGRRESYRCVPVPRMSNTYLLPGRDDLDTMLARTERGLFVKKMGGGEVDPTSGDFVFYVSEGHIPHRKRKARRSGARRDTDGQRPGGAAQHLRAREQPGHGPRNVREVGAERSRHRRTALDAHRRSHCRRQRSMREQEAAPSRRRRKSPPKEKAKARKFDIKEIFGELRTAFKIFNIVAALVTLYVIASLYTPWTGDAGAATAGWLLSNIGGAVIIPLLFLLYTEIKLILASPMNGWLRHLCGMFFIFIFLSMTLGLNRLTGGERELALPFAAAGKFGYGMSSAIYKSTGILGTVLAGLLTIYLTLMAFNIHLLSFIKLPSISLPSFSLPKFGRRAKEGGEPEEYEEEADVEYDEVYDGESDENDAPNISEFDGDKDYFDYDEERPERDKYDAPPVLRRGRAAGAAAEAEEDEEGIDYNDPESLKNAGEPALHPTIQDPNFNFEEGGSRRVKQGIFPPPIEIFGPSESRDGEMDEEKAAPLGEKIVRALEQFGIESHLAEILVGPTVIQFRIQLAPGIKVSKVAALANDIALAMAVPSLRIEAPIPGKPYVGIEIPNPKRRGIPLRTVIEDDGFQHTKLALPLPFGVAVNGDSIIVGLEELPHLLVAGTTGSGKSVFVNSCIVGLCSKRTPEELRMILVDPKRVEMAVYDKLPHLLTPPVTDPKKAVQALAWLIREMENRYTTFAKIRVRNLEGYNEKVLPKDRLPHIVIVVDELADLMMTAAKEVEEYICRLAQMARATGIHLMLATQRPSVNIITGLIKANIPARVAFTLPSNADSRTIIDCAGAEKLLGKGDMLFLSTKHPKPIRIQSPWIDEKILAGWLAYITNTFGEPEFIEIEAQGEKGGSGGSGGTFDDDLLEEAVETVLATGIASASGLQRRLRVGFSRASRLIDMMEQLGIVGPADGSRPRDLLVDEEGAQELLDEARGK